MRGRRTWIWQGSAVIIIGFVLAALMRDPGAWWVGLALGILAAAGMAVAASARRQVGSEGSSAPSFDNEPVPIQVQSTDRMSKGRGR